MADIKKKLKFTPVQQRIMKILADGMSHSATELRKCQNDELAIKHNIIHHIHLLRKKIAQIGLGIVTERLNNTLYFRLTQIIRNKD